MDCLRSFNFIVNTQSNWGSPEISIWTVGGQNFFTFERSSPSGSKYTIQGFKNINIFKIEVTGDINSTPQFDPYLCIVQNWWVIFTVTGQNSSSVGEVRSSPNVFNMIEQSTDPRFKLSKYQSSLTFESPIQSAKEILITEISADGIGNRTLLSAQIGYLLNFTVYYKFEGE